MANPFSYQDPALQTTTQSGFTTKKIVDVMQVFVIFLSLLVVMYLFFIIPSQVDGSSMYPNLVNDQILFTNRVVQIFGGKGHLIPIYNYQRGDIVVFKIDNYEKDLVKRVIGLPGDRVMVKQGRVYVNGQLLEENYIDQLSYPTKPGSFMQEGVEKTVPENQYLLMGDNRPGSTDSREFGFIPRNKIKGSPFMRVYPLNKITRLKRGEYASLINK